MIAAEYKNGNLVIRIHDECYERVTEQSLAHAGHIISASYKRRQAEAGNAYAALTENDAAKNWQV